MRGLIAWVVPVVMAVMMAMAVAALTAAMTAAVVAAAEAAVPAAAERQRRAAARVGAFAFWAGSGKLPLSGWVVLALPAHFGGHKCLYSTRGWLHCFARDYILRERS